jgi:hypothetical protein
MEVSAGDGRLRCDHQVKIDENRSTLLSLKTNDFIGAFGALSTRWAANSLWHDSNN